MMNYAIIENGIVVNVTVCDDPAFAAEQGWIAADENAEVGGTYAGGVFTRKPAPPAPAPTVADVQSEASRRLSAGFDYNFNDVRGVHVIGTTSKDLAGWDEVRALASARVATNDTTPITIATDTGITQIAPDEWALIDLAAAAFRQPIWAASFALQAADPIPADYADDKWW